MPRRLTAGGGKEGERDPKIDGVKSTFKHFFSPTVALFTHIHTHTYTHTHTHTDGRTDGRNADAPVLLHPHGHIEQR